MRILFFAPHSAIWIHSFPEALVAETLAQQGHEVTYVGCGGLLNAHCVVMSAHSVPFGAPAKDRDRICRICRRSLETLRGNFGFEGPDLMSLVGGEDLLAADELTASRAPEDCFALTLDGIEVGRLALYEMVIQRKRGSLEFDPAEAQRYRTSLKNVILVLRVIKRLFDDAKPDRVVVYNALYSVNRVVCRLAETRGIAQYYLHAGDNLSRRLKTLVLARGHAFTYYKYLREQWSKYRDRPCPSGAMRAATDHLLEVARGRSLWAYSAPSGGNADLRRRFGIEPDRRVICATMSSDDERFGGETIGVLPTLDDLLFPKQVDWIRALVDFVSRRQDLFLVIRVHPREFPNKREGVLSEHALLLQETFVKLPANVVVNWPTEGISLYDLAKITDVFANAWSSAGREMAWLGIPVVLYTEDLTLYPAELNYVGTTLADYFGKIEQALADGWNSAWIRRTYRWCAAELYYSSLDISESFSKDEHRSALSKGLSRVMRTLAPSYEMERDCRSRAGKLAASDRVNRIVTEMLPASLDEDGGAGEVTYAEETELMKREIRRLVAGLYGPSAPSRGNPLAGKLLHYANS